MNGACERFRPWNGTPVPPKVAGPCGNCGRSYFDHENKSLHTAPTMIEESVLDAAGASVAEHICYNGHAPGCAHWSPERPSVESDYPKGPGDSVPSHYQGEGMQPFDIVRAFGLDYFEGNVLKYLLRWRKKNGLEDLKKAAHYLACIIEWVEEGGKDV